MRYSVIWFCYRLDSDLLRESVTSVVRALPEARLTVCDDGANAIPRAARAWLEERGVTYRKTWFPRGGNLRGGDSLAGQLREMSRAAEGADVLVKMDCDTLLVNADWLRELESAPEAVMAAHYKGIPTYPIGSCYALRSELLPRLEEDAAKYPPIVNCLEDYEVGSRVMRLTNGDPDAILRWPCAPEEGFWLCGPREVGEHVLQGRVVSCGYTWGACPQEQRAQYKAEQVAIMQRINNDLAARDAAAQNDKQQNNNND